MEDTLEKLKQTWQTLGRDDPLWAIASVQGKRGGKWTIEEFLSTADADLNYYCRILKEHASAPDRFGQVLDFGCGVGRLSLAWSKRADAVTGVDISSSMIERGKALLKNVPNVQLRVNEASDLACFKSNTFDVVFSHACLQHIPWPLAAGYLREFARVCSPNGWVCFSLPARVLDSTWGAHARKRIVEMLPFGLGAIYRRWRHGSEAVFEMHFTPAETVQATLVGAGLLPLHREPDKSAGENTEGFFYVFKKPQP